MSYPSTAQAITISKTGGPEVIEKREIPFSKAAPSHLVVKASVQMPQASRGAQLIVQQKDYTSLWISHSRCTPTDESVLNDPDYKKRGYKEGSPRLQSLRITGFACGIRFCTWKTVYVIPESVSTLTAVSALVQGLTAISFMEESYNVQKGDIILIHTVAGGLGLLMTQLAKSRGATKKLALAKANGTDHVILYKSEDTVARVLELTNGEVFMQSLMVFESDLVMIRRKGTLVSVGNASGPVPPFAPSNSCKKTYPSMNNYTYTPAEALHYGNALFSLLANGTLKTQVFKEYPFTTEGVKQAQIDLTSGKSTGKLVVKVND
ncbi:uncharacterized protein BJ212DRAFT_1300887 [Suillus subaureus]|uniref:Enoyl reductase (ER) domain-containing protein n=1 Tax=Suillus subaureus TaxID=48587 RepID=A0A9P7JC99_9AGAM|nr:uncharacterized protein BJ212DRAFT_1300887 [Suillus subaureus]KAG1814029.1 hypothetical protein BJ212DRAFT_1300887 [Suillus subaureus]